MTSTRSPRGPYAKTKIQREKILQGALDYFGQYGYWGFSMRELARHVGLSQAGLLHHFGTKTDLLTAVLEERDRSSEEAVMTSGASGMSALDRITAIVALNASQRNIVKLFMVLSSEATNDDHPAHDYFRNRYVRISSQVAGLLRNAANDGEIEPLTNYQAASRVTLAVMFGLQIQWLLDPTVDMVALFRSHLDSSYPAP